MQLAPALILLALICAALGLCGYLFVTLKKEIYRRDKEAGAAARDSLERMETLRREIAELRTEMDRMPGFAPAVPSGTSMNLNKRTQAIRMIRMGDGIQQIASALSLPRNEVALLIKIQELLRDSTR